MSHDDIFNSRYGPRTARGGIKSQTARGKFGKNWWAQRWLSVLEELDLGGRLARGRVYARRGQVLSIDVQEGAIEAKVQGSRLHPYVVKIRVKTISMENWILLSETAFSQAIVAAKLLAGEMPENIEALFGAHGLSLFPKSMDDFETDCTCPDFSNPCKHIASVYYLLAEEFDRDPFLIFRMRGLDKEKLIDLVTRKSNQINQGAVDPARSSVSRAESMSNDKARTKSKKQASIIESKNSNLKDETEKAETEKAETEKAETEKAETERAKTKSAETKKAEVKKAGPEFPLEDFWKCQPSSHLVGPIQRPAAAAGLPKRLGNFSFWRSSYPFIPSLEQIYKIAADNAVRDLANEKFEGSESN